jgi:hypothetical protein
VWAFGVAPAVLDTSGSRDETVNQSFTLVNDNELDTMFYFETLKVEAKDESGSPKFIPYNTDHSELPDWITLSTKKLVVPARSFVEVPFSINIPSDIESKSYYAAITVTDQAPANVDSIQTKTAILVFLTVKGQTIEQASLLDLVVLPSQSDRFLGTATYRIQNQGNVYLQPTGEIIFKDIFGRTLSITDANPENSRVLPETTRAFETGFGNENYWSNLAIGPISAELTLNYGVEGKMNSKTTFWIIPWQLILSIIGLLTILIGIKTSLKKK